jgi:8-oxo-dGTP diphosphatase
MTNGNLCAKYAQYVHIIFIAFQNILSYLSILTMSLIEAYLKENVVEFTPAVVCYPIQGEEVILGFRVKVSNDLGKGIFVGPGGKHDLKEDGSLESSEEALIRECQQELDVTPTEYAYKGNVRFIFPSKPKWCMSVDVFLVTSWQGIVADISPTNLDSYLASLSEPLPEIIPVIFPQAEIPFHRMWADNRYWVPKVIAGGNVNLTFLYDDEGKKVVDWVER